MCEGGGECRLLDDIEGSPHGLRPSAGCCCANGAYAFVLYTCDFCRCELPLCDCLRAMIYGPAVTVYSHTFFCVHTNFSIGAVFVDSVSNGLVIQLMLGVGTLL